MKRESLLTGLRQQALSGLSRAQAAAAASPHVRRLVYEVRNRRSFSDLYQHDRMLADRVRVDAYAQGLAKHLRPDDVVIDLGTGTGVLAMLAARSARTVHAIEHGTIVTWARAVAAENGLGNIDFHAVNSQAFDLDEPVDVIVHEQIGDYAFNERVVDNVVDLRDRLLKPGGRILPGRLDLFLEPVQLAEEFAAPYAWTQDLHGLTFRALEPLGLEQTPGYRRQVFRPFPFGHLLSDPRPALTVDLHTIERDGLPTALTVERTVVAPGRLDGWVVWFAAHFDDELSFDSAPTSTPTSWGTPLLRSDSRPLEVGDVVRLHLTAEDLASQRTWAWTDTG